METRIDTLTENPAPELTRARVGSLPVLPVAASVATQGVRRNPMRALRLPEQDDPAPGSTRMLGMSAWAALLVLVGAVVAVRVFLAIVFEPGPDWLMPTVMSVGIAGTVCGGLAFATVHHRWLPWELLGTASLLLGGNLLLVITQL
ncbi:MAG: hypothetical protein HOU81_21605 [Hamadaea sp.]|uniref:hypothetical protein n=1 Tax=Hamadaea sp. TaxID=2024425 RepID=UPI0017A2E6C3|nr:hypothetical protein [Hamadaea sp.]NUR73423.1 hypothetical protein [Hamadaea sp.]NUT20673.1 hypothetical protein [Hamadaea sp.]